MTDQAKIAEIRTAYEVIKRNGLHLDYEHIDFLLSELDRKDSTINELKGEVERLKEERKVLESEYPGRTIIALQQDRDKLIDDLKDGINELQELGQIAWERWKKEGDMYEQGRANALDSAEQVLHGILEEIGVGGG